MLHPLRSSLGKVNLQEQRLKPHSDFPSNASTRTASVAHQCQIPSTCWNGRLQVLPVKFRGLKHRRVCIGQGAPAISLSACSTDSRAELVSTTDSRAAGPRGGRPPRRAAAAAALEQHHIMHGSPTRATAHHQRAASTPLPQVGNPQTRQHILPCEFSALNALSAMTWII